MNDSAFAGFPVRGITPGSPADKAGVHVGDAIVIANGVRVQNADDYREARSMRSDAVNLTVLRGNQMLEFTLEF